MVKEFFKPNWKKIFLTIFLLLLTGWMVFKWMSVGLWDTLIPVVMVLGLPLVFSLMCFFAIGVGLYMIGSLIIEILWLYIISCILMKIIIFIKNKLTLIKWDAKKIIPLTIIITVGIVIYGFINFGFGDIFVPTADDSGATIEGVKNIVKANNQFAIELYSKISNESNDNIFFSPWSISTAMAMVYEGARGDTAKEIRDVFHFPENDSLRRFSYAKMLNTINKAGGKYELHTANAIWLQKNYSLPKDYLGKINYSLLEEYKNTISRYYLGEIKNLDFVNNPSDASSYINNWVAKNTNNKIKNIVSPSMFNECSFAVLTNAIYFKGKWEHQFDKDDTKPEDFTLQSGLKIKVPMMRLEDDDLKFKYTESNRVQILEMPYQGDKISMLILLPRSNITYLESILTEEKLQEWRGKLKPETVYIYLPKFTFKTSYSLKDYLKEMGMNLSFTWPGADFSGIDGTKMLYIDKVLHKAYIDVYEEGTEAAASTTISMQIGAAMPRYVVFRADHPFIFIIQEKEMGNILFIGRVNNPTQ